MYATPIAVPVATKSKSVLLSIAGIGCIALLFFMVAATIVLALIPIYTRNTGVAVDPTGFTSKESRFLAEIEQNPTINGRRRRAEGDLEPYVGGEFGPLGKEMVSSKLKEQSGSNSVDSVPITSVTIGYRDNNRTSRFALKRQAQRVKRARAIVLVIIFRIVYKRSCNFGCQTSNGVAIRRNFLSRPPSVFVFTNVDLFRNGVFWLNVNRIQCVSILFVSFIIPGRSDETTQIPPTTGSPATNATITPTTTPSTTTPSTITPTTTPSTMTPTTTMPPTQPIG